MKPKTQFQQQVADASARLPKITSAQVRWARENCIQHIGRRTAKGVITCTKCGHKWQGDGYLVETLTECRCPHCDAKLQVETTRRFKFNDWEYLCVATTFEGFQVLRFLYVECWMKAGEKAQYAHQEVVQRWIAPNGKYATIARLRPSISFSHGWNLQSDLEIRPEKPLYNITPTRVYPNAKHIPELVQRGYRGAFGRLTPFDVMQALLCDPKAETLYKAGQKALLKYFILHYHKLDEYWPSIRIVLRNNYQIADADMWVDYVNQLRFFGRDLRNAHYVCPADLHAEHDRYVAKRQELHDGEKLKVQRAKAREAEGRFRELRERFFGVEFTDGEVSIHVLQSVDEVMREGDAMHHCVFTNEYHLKPDSLLLSACKGDQRLETIEFSLSRLAVTQSRGKCNTSTPYHARIIDLVNQNITAIQRRMVA